MKGSINVVAVITARGGSKGLHRKNIRLLKGKHLIGWTIDAALAASSLSRVIVSTDDTEIAEISKSYGAEVPFLRPKEMAQDSSPHIDVVLHALEWLIKGGENIDYLMLLQPTSPLRTTEDIESIIEMCRDDGVEAAYSVSEAHEHPLLLRTMNDEGVLEPFVKNDASEKYLRRQDLPPVYFANGAIYLNRCESLQRDRTFYPEGAKGYIMPEDRSVQIDTLLDFRLVEAALEIRNHEG